ncbi:hypothetical protein OpiT1DRAFT_03786 [Opitutaceae bacterium TAV1]|nr:hypothetical protein OpiT1DRAFT_03786 [Opitutaceae bacterium TAV1]
MPTPISSAAFQSTMEAAGYRIRRPGVISSFMAPCPEKRGFCFAIWHDDVTEGTDRPGSAPGSVTVFRSIFQIVGDISLPAVTRWYLEHDYDGRFRLDLELSIHGGLTHDYLLRRMTVLGDLIASRIVPDLHGACRSWAFASQPVSGRLASRLKTATENGGSDPAARCEARPSGFSNIPACAA